MKNRTAYIIPYFISMEGCRHRCIYCNQHLFKGHERKKEAVIDAVNRHLEYFKDKERCVELAFYGGTFLSLPLKKIDKLLREADRLRKEGVIGSVRISTTPDSVTEDSCKMLKGRVETVELGVQSLDNFILKSLRRDYDERRVIEATECLKKHGFKTGHQLMLGLPFERFNAFADTVEKTIRMKPDFVRLYPLIIFKNTPLDMYYKLGVFAPCGLDELIKTGAYALFRFAQAEIKVIRVGLTGFTEKADVRFDYGMEDYKGAMQSFLWREFIKQNPELVFFEIQCSSADYQAIVGRNKENLKYFKNMGVELNLTKGDLQAWELNVCGKIHHLSGLDWSAIP